MIPDEIHSMLEIAGELPRHAPYRGLTVALGSCAVGDLAALLQHIARTSLRAARIALTIRDAAATTATLTSSRRGQGDGSDEAGWRRPP